MRNAEESRSMAIHSASLEIAEIETRIDEAIAEGHLSIKVPDIGEAVKSALREKGYTVVWMDPSRGRYYIGYWKISWDK